MDTVLHYIFLDLRKFYGALDRELCLDILAGYGAGPSTLHIMRTYWDGLQMAEKAGGHCNTIFQIPHRVTQGYPCQPLYLTWYLTLLFDTE